MALVKFVQDLVMPLGLRLLHLRVDGGDEFIADYCRDYCKTTAIIQQSRLPNTPEQNGLSERDGRIIMDATRCMLNGAALSKSFGGEIVATVVFLHHPTNKKIGGDTLYKVFGKHANLSFLWTIRNRSHGDRQAHLGLSLQHTQSPHYLQSKQQLRADWLLRRFTRHRQPGKSEVSIREHVLSLWGIIQFSAHIFCDNKARGFCF